MSGYHLSFDFVHFNLSIPEKYWGFPLPTLDQVLTAYLNLVENHCLNLVKIPQLQNLPEIPQNVDNRCIYNSWAGEYIVDYDENPIVTAEDRETDLGKPQEILKKMA